MPSPLLLGVRMCRPAPEGVPKISNTRASVATSSGFSCNSWRSGGTYGTYFVFRQIRTRCPQYNTTYNTTIAKMIKSARATAAPTDLRPATDRMGC